MGIAVPGASSPGEFWRLLNTGQPQFSEPSGNYRLDSFWSADPDAEDRTYVRVSGFLSGLLPHPRLAAEMADGLFTRQDSEAIWLRHCLLQAGEGVTARAGDRGRCVIGGTGLTSQGLDEAIVIEHAAHQISARLRNGTAADTERLRSLLRDHFGHTGLCPAQLLPSQVVCAAVSGVAPGGCAVTVVDAACSSSLYAIDLGARYLLDGDCEIAYCGGMSGITPRFSTALAKLGGLTRRARLRVFDRRTDGTLFSEAAAVVALKTLIRALEDNDRVLGVLAGFGASSAGRGRSVCGVSPAGQSLCIERAQRAAGLDASQVDWVIAHGTGTVAGDAAELAALAATAPSRGRLCASNKPITGHTGWSAGAVSVIHALLALSHGRIPAHHGFSVPPPGSPIGTRIEVPVQSRPWIRRDGQPRTVGVSAIGFGGTYGHLLIREYIPRRAAPPKTPPPDPVVLVAWAAQPPPFDDIRLPLHLAAMVVAEYGELWAPVRDTTGVIATLTGPVPLAVGNLMRCYAAELERLFTGADATALAAFLADVRDEHPPTSRDTLPGIMPNIMAARLAHVYDLHGLTMLVDSGPTSAHTALDVAGRYLTDGELDMALVLAVNVTEGGWMLALTRSSVARRHGWQARGGWRETTARSL